ncbi:MAG: endonuclease III domain-containing protein, partial [Pygmaiobacter massiliensis]
ARDIHLCMTELIETYDGKVPDDFDKVRALPGVGRKSSNLIMGDVFGKPAIVTDTHCIRLCGRMGLTKNKEPKKVEMDLWKIIPPEESNDFCHRLVLHGRAVCDARKPQCDRCAVKEYCETFAKQQK